MSALKMTTPVMVDGNSESVDNPIIEVKKQCEFQINFRCFRNEFLNLASKLKVEDKDTLRVIDCTVLHCNRWFSEGRSDAAGMFERLYA